MDVDDVSALHTLERKPCGDLNTARPYSLCDGLLLVEHVTDVRLSLGGVSLEDCICTLVVGPRGLPWAQILDGRGKGPPMMPHARQGDELVVPHLEYLLLSPQCRLLFQYIFRETQSPPQGDVQARYFPLPLGRRSVGRFFDVDEILAEEETVPMTTAQVLPGAAGLVTMPTTNAGTQPPRVPRAPLTPQTPHAMRGDCISPPLWLARELFAMGAAEPHAGHRFESDALQAEAETYFEGIAGCLGDMPPPLEDAADAMLSGAPAMDMMGDAFATDCVDTWNMIWSFPSAATFPPSAPFAAIPRPGFVGDRLDPVIDLCDSP